MFLYLSQYNSQEDRDVKSAVDLSCFADHLESISMSTAFEPCIKPQQIEITMCTLHSLIITTNKFIPRGVFHSRKFRNKHCNSRDSRAQHKVWCYMW